jgi:hypothetical protein
LIASARCNRDDDVNEKYNNCKSLHHSYCALVLLHSFQYTAHTLRYTYLCGHIAQKRKQPACGLFSFVPLGDKKLYYGQTVLVNATAIGFELPALSTQYKAGTDAVEALSGAAAAHAPEPPRDDMQFDWFHAPAAPTVTVAADPPYASAAALTAVLIPLTPPTSAVELHTSVVLPARPIRYALAFAS